MTRRLTLDPSSSQPAAKIFYVAFTADQHDPTERPVTFFYNGGPGSSSVYVMLGSFAPMRLKTSMPSFTPPAPYRLEPNPDSPLDRSDLVFINPVGTGYSAAVAPKVNKDFWGVDQDAGSLRQFIKHLLPTLCADACYHQKATVTPRPADLPTFMDQVVPFALGDYARALAAFPDADPATVTTLSQYTGVSPVVLTSWEGLNVADSDSRGTLHFLTTLMRAEGRVLGAYDGRVLGVNTGIAGPLDPLSGGNDATMTAVNGAYTAMWNSYLADGLKFTSTSAFTDLNDQAFQNWDPPTLRRCTTARWRTGRRYTGSGPCNAGDERRRPTG
jgi:carboxypeptidase C (cathepsin A)